MSARAGFESDTAAYSVFLFRGEGCLQAQAVEVVLQTPSFTLVKRPCSRSMMPVQVARRSASILAVSLATRCSNKRKPSRITSLAF
jgi:hypothetical protein